MSTSVLAVASALPENYYSQAELVEAFREAWGGQFFNPRRLEELHRNVLVGGRYLALPRERYLELGFGQANDAWIEVALTLAERVVPAALEAAGIPAEDLAALVSTTVTGIATPSLEARLMNRLPLPADLRRLPLFGLGCLAGAAGVARAAELSQGLSAPVLLLSVELCSLTLQREDLSIANLIASGLFGDGAAAVVLGPEPRAGSARVVASRSSFYRDTERVMGWDVSEKGFEIVLSAEVPEMVRRHLRRDVDTFLADQGLEREQIDHWIAHPGGPRVLEVLAESLELPEGALDRTWRSLREVGNLSSTSVLLVLEEVMGERPAPGERGLMIAMGPGFCAELVLLQW